MSNTPLCLGNGTSSLAAYMRHIYVYMSSIAYFWLIHMYVENFEGESCYVQEDMYWMSRLDLQVKDKITMMANEGMLVRNLIQWSLGMLAVYAVLSDFARKQLQMTKQTLCHQTVVFQVKINHPTRNECPYKHTSTTCIDPYTIVSVIALDSSSSFIP